MYRTLVNCFNYSFTEEANILIYRLKKIPLLGSKIPEEIYSKTEFKKGFGIIQTVFNVVQNFIMKFLYFYILMVIPSKFFINRYDIGKYENIFLQIFFVMNCICGSIFRSEIFQNKASSYKMIKFMRTPAKEYYFTIVAKRILLQSLYYSLSFFILGISNPFFIVIELAAFRIVGEWINMKLFERYKIVIEKEKVLVSIVMILIPIISYLPIIFNCIFDFQYFFNNYIVLLISILIFLIFLKKLYKRNNYKLIANKVLYRNSLVDMDSDESLNFNDVKIRESKSEKNIPKFNSKSGYEYLNSIFFFRNRRLVKNSIQIKSIAILVISAVILAIIFISKKDMDFNSLKTIEPQLIIIMNWICSTEKICKSMFFNCDISLLRYGFYKNPEGILNNFKCRVKKLLLFNLIPTITLIIVLITIVLSMGCINRIVEILPVLISIISLYLFFTMYSLFLYYILQPYTADLKIKSDAFVILNNIIYFIGFGCFKIKEPSIYFTITIIVVTTLFVPLSLYLIYKFAPKTFKIK